MLAAAPLGSAAVSEPCLCECSAYDCSVPARGKAVVKTDIAIAIPPGTYARIAPRSGLAVKHFIDTGKPLYSHAHAARWPWSCRPHKIHLPCIDNLHTVPCHLRNWRLFSRGGFFVTHQRLVVSAAQYPALTRQQRSQPVKKDISILKGISEDDDVLEYPYNSPFWLH